MWTSGDQARKFRELKRGSIVKEIKHEDKKSMATIAILIINYIVVFYWLATAVFMLPLLLSITDGVLPKLAVLATALAPSIVIIINIASHYVKNKILFYSALIGNSIMLWVSLEQIMNNSAVIENSISLLKNGESEISGVALGLIVGMTMPVIVFAMNMRFYQISILILIFLIAGYVKKPNEDVKNPEETARLNGDPYKVLFLKDCRNDQMGGGATAEVCTCAYEKVSGRYSLQQYKEKKEKFEKAVQKAIQPDASFEEIEELILMD
jgi:hypothetical protein